ncbi:conserved membrane hypothetical protein [Desulfosarcina cetonica]|uniref:hypothetical protein n=1 Tax=Desulfosarcina cetonica TaxID=90730 RepID=UPI0006D26434|nr:hypothetical protein [Desulfosarcina cetonica]VTR64980.1 conserved membrane hypothetical protein [Desulfosarcina cetonica]
MTPSIRTTLIYGLISALVVMPVAGWLAGPIGGSMAFKLTLWLDLLIYALLLARWGRRHPATILFPMGLLLGAALWPGVYTGFFCLGLGMLAWIRSGICFTTTPLRALLAETIAIGGGIALTVFFHPTTAISWAIAIWLFFLMQALYFFIVPSSRRDSSATAQEDPFERACRDVKRLLEE